MRRGTGPAVTPPCSRHAGARSHVLGVSRRDVQLCAYEGSEDDVIEYSVGQKLQLRVKDVGSFDGFAVFVNGHLIDEIADQDMHAYEIDRPSAPMAVVVHFGGNDGGTSVIVDITDPLHKIPHEKQTGLRHSYLIVPG